MCVFECEIQCNSITYNVSYNKCGSRWCWFSVGGVVVVVGGGGGGVVIVIVVRCSSRSLCLTFTRKLINSTYAFIPIAH